MSNELQGPLAPREYGDRRKKNMDVWYYEEPYGITVVCGTNADCKMVVIPRSAIEAYLARDSEGQPDQK